MRPQRHQSSNEVHISPPPIYPLKQPSDIMRVPSSLYSIDQAKSSVLEPENFKRGQMVSLDSGQPIMTRTSKDNIFNTEAYHINQTAKEQTDDLKDI